MAISQLSSFSTAFKEWACVVRALGKGEQTIIFRKGGIHENKFSAEHEGFFLFSTYEHQKMEDLNPRGKEILEESQIQKPAADAEFAWIEYFAQLEDVFHVTDLAKLDPINSFHIWAPSALEKRFHYGDAPGLCLMVVRVFRMPQREKLLWHPDYNGCKSWIDLKEPIRISGMVPVISPSRFAETQEVLRAHLR